MDDHLLLERIRRSDGRAFAELRARYQQQLLARVQDVLVDRGLSEEVVQDVWLHFWQHVDEVDLSRGSVGAWLKTLGHRRAVDCVRSVQAARERDRAWTLRQAAAGIDEPDRSLAVLLHRPRLQAALAALSEHQRTAVAMRHFGEMTHPEIARHLGVALATAKTRYRDGFLRLQDQMSELERIK